METLPHVPPATATRGGSRWSVLVLLCLAQFMVILDVTVVNVALPSIGEQLRLDRSELTWIVTAYALCFGGLLMLGGRLADLLGRRAVFLLGLTVFTVASFGAGVVNDGTYLVALRAVQGVGAALLSPAALAIVTTTFHGPARHRALTVWAAIGGSGAAAGVLVGGLLVSGPGWQWVFFVNVPVGLLVAALVPRVVPTVAGQARRLDLPGALLITVAAAAMIYGLVKAGDTGWASPSALVPIGAGLALYAAFVAVERRVTAPLVHLPMMTARPMAAGTAVMLAASGLLIAGFFLCSLLLQRRFGLSALETGLMFLPVAIATIVSAHLGSHLIRRAGPRPAAAVAFALAAAGFGLLTQVDTSGTAVIEVLPGFVLTAAGLGAGFVTATTTAMSQIGADHAGAASGVLNTAHELGAALGVAAASAMAGASIDTSEAAGTGGGFTGAFLAAAVLAAATAAAAPWLLPAGRPAPGDQPMFVH